MQRNPYGISSIWSLVMVVLLSGVIGVSIPLMSGGLPRRQGDAQNSPTPAHSEMFANQAGTPAILAEAAGRSDGTVGQWRNRHLSFQLPLKVQLRHPRPRRRSWCSGRRRWCALHTLASVNTQQAATPSLAPLSFSQPRLHPRLLLLCSKAQQRFLQLRHHP